jgi:hypothetical protein
MERNYSDAGKFQEQQLVGRCCRAALINLGCAATQPYQKLRRQFFAVRQMVTVPADQSVVALMEFS